uniref:Uncharacterized protein n=1 Tax=Acrobeloides nanus TaxID=290746 RepID=A0A914CQL5_9BILA
MATYASDNKQVEHFLRHIRKEASEILLDIQESKDDYRKEGIMNHLGEKRSRKFPAKKAPIANDAMTSVEEENIDWCDATHYCWTGWHCCSCCTCCPDGTICSGAYCVRAKSHLRFYD